MELNNLLLATIFIPLVSSVLANASEHTLTIPNSEYDGPVTAELTSIWGGLDRQKITPRPNITTFDWWYFDAVSTSSQNESLTIVFYEAGAESLSIADVPLLYIIIYGSFSNGTLFKETVPAGKEITISQSQWGIHGDWQGTGMAFYGTSLDEPQSVYTVTVNSPSIGIQGTLHLRSSAPAHYPCSLNKPGETEEVIPRIGWANAQPDAVVSADFTVNGTKLSFTGVGYHDKNWGLSPLVDLVQSWYWGHARLGPYSLVWFDTRTPDGKEYHSGYVAQHGRVLQASCSDTSVTARPYGKNSEYPPVPETGTPEGMTLRFNIEGQGTLIANVTTQLVVEDIGFYQRYIGPVVGGFEGKEKFEGKALYEEFKFPL